ncbi:hypothetical protein Micbo1qcDRAFT_168884 [Microdochium bolleyi]|uniref:Uncharacterized protein n=1 Tax=Microdochium bolleyi TaxID=196109 RepID=A0A136IMC2_9PEZI|nr:hypothetical protein Micbo1qcDRAFT_168884 [Microdochium bolleyi]
MQAVERSSAPVVELLLSKGANVDAIDTNYRTAHDLAVFLELDEMAALLLAHKANLEKARQ